MHEMLKDGEKKVLYKLCKRQNKSKFKEFARRMKFAGNVNYLWQYVALIDDPLPTISGTYEVPKLKWMDARELLKLLSEERKKIGGDQVKAVENIMIHHEQEALLSFVIMQCSYLNMIL